MDECWQQQVIDRAEALAQFNTVDIDGSQTLEPNEIGLLVFELTGQKLKGKLLNRAILDILGFSPDDPAAPNPKDAHIDFERFFGLSAPCHVVLFLNFAAQRIFELSA
eukprot:SAG31_NODE_472_length_15237_cov_3.424891_6_plen_108_part_00